MFDEGPEGLFSDLGAPLVEELFPGGESPATQIIFEREREVVKRELFALEGDYRVDVSESYEFEKYQRTARMRRVYSRRMRGVFFGNGSAVRAQIGTNSIYTRIKVGGTLTAENG